MFRRELPHRVTHVRELESIRKFLTGSPLTLILDVIFGGVFLALIFHHSATLGWIVTASVPLYGAFSVLATVALRSKRCGDRTFPELI